MRQQFNLSLWLQDKSRKVVTRDGRPVRIVCWDRKYDHNDFPIIALKDWDNGEFVNFVSSNGKVDLSGSENIHDLFFAEAEVGLTEFEKEVAEAYEWAKTTEREDFVNEFAPKLLGLAREEIGKENSEYKPKFTYEYNDKDYSKLANKLIEFRNNTPLCSVSYRDGEGRKVILHYEKEILDLARKELLKGLPELEKTKDVIDPTIPVMYTDAASMKTYVEYNGYKLCINDTFEKLPKEK